MVMRQKTFFLISGVVFAGVALLHALRLLFRWEVMIGGCRAPYWVSAAGLLLAGSLAYAAFGLLRHSK